MEKILKTLKSKMTFLAMLFAAILLITASCEKAPFGPNGLPENQGMKSAMALPPGDASIAEIVVASAEDDEPQFTLLLAALEYTGLTGVFTGGEQYTVFAPTDQAFLNLVAALPLAGVEGDTPFEKIDNYLGAGTVANVLLYHVTEGRRAANSVVPKRGFRTIETLLGATFKVYPDLSIVAIGNDANILSANISASNGIIHVIDTVILPVDLGLVP